MSLRALLANRRVRVTTIAAAVPRADSLRRTIVGLSREQFRMRGPALWLIRALEVHERAPVLYRTLSDAIQLGATSAVRENEPLLPRLRFDPGAFACHPLRKGAANPWRDRVLLGRAPNNDVVLRDDWVSKLHAWFELSEGDGRLYDAQSVNGTWANGVRIRWDEPAEIRSGTRLRFGRLCCEVVGSGELFDALS